MAYEIADKPVRVYLADLIRWMNRQAGAQKSRPAGKAFRWEHRAARHQLEKELEIVPYQHAPGVEGSKIYYLSDDLQEKAPDLFKAYFKSGKPSAAAEEA